MNDPYIPAAANGAAPFTLPHFKAWAAELELDNGEPWIVEPFFCEFVLDYFMGIPENWLLVPEGNSKTTSLGGFAVYLLEYRRRAGIPWAASSRDQAEIGYRQAEGFVYSSPRLKSFLKCQEGYRRIKNLLDGGRIQVFAADDGTGDGVIPTDAFLDELHRHKSLKLYRTWSGKLWKRGAQMATISTAGEPGSEFEETRQKIRKTTPVVESGPCFTHCRSERLVLHDWSVPEDADVEDIELVKAANPFSGVTIESLREKRNSPTMTLAHWRRFSCNLPTREDASAITEAEWDMARVADGIPDGVPRWAGLDVAWKRDTTALVPFWWRDDEYRLFDKPVILEPPRDGNSLKPKLIKEALKAEHERGPIEVLVMDTSRAEDIAAWAEEELGCEVVDRQQSDSLAVMDYERWMEALRHGWLKHTGDPGLRQHVLNAIARLLPKGQTRFDRPKVSRAVGHELARLRVIDALTAASMVHCVAVAEHAEIEAPEPWVMVA